MVSRDGDGDGHGDGTAFMRSASCVGDDIRETEMQVDVNGNGNWIDDSQWTLEG